MWTAIFNTDGNVLTVLWYNQDRQASDEAHDAQNIEFYSLHKLALRQSLISVLTACNRLYDGKFRTEPVIIGYNLKAYWEKSQRTQQVFGKAGKIVVVFSCTRLVVVALFTYR